MKILTFNEEKFKCYADFEHKIISIVGSIEGREYEICSVSKQEDIKVFFSPLEQTFIITQNQLNFIHQVANYFDKYYEKIK